MIRELAIITGVHWLVVLFYLLATIGNTWGLLFNREKVERLAHRLLIVGLLIHGAAILSWWFIVGHGPYLARFEILSAMAWVMVVLYLVFRHFFPPVRPASLLVYPAALLLIGLGVFCTPAVQTLPPTFRGIWLVLHVTLYIISLPTIVITLAISLGYILKKRTGYAWVARLPDSETLDLLAYRFAGFGFVFWSLAMLTGAIWAYQAWGRFWGWDPIETWSLITWGSFGLYLHLRRFFGLQGEKAAALFVLCCCLSIISLFFVPILASSVHSEYFK